MSDEERLKWLKEIEKDIFVCSLESTFVEDAKSCAIHSAIEELENQKSLQVELEKIKAEIGAKVFEIQPTSDKYFGGVDDVMDIVSSIIDKHISELKEGAE